MKTTSSGPKGGREAGVEYDIEDAEAKDLVDGGYAEEVKAAEPAAAAEEVGEGASAKEVEVATKPEPENAATRTKPPKKRRKG